jgi:hypothetical protein
LPSKGPLKKGGYQGIVKLSLLKEVRRDEVGKGTIQKNVSGVFGTLRKFLTLLNLENNFIYLLKMMFNKFYLIPINPHKIYN